MKLITVINVFLLCQEFGSSANLNFTSYVQKTTDNDIQNKMEFTEGAISTVSFYNKSSSLHTEKLDVFRNDSNPLKPFQNVLLIPARADQSQVNKQRRKDKKRKKHKHKHKRKEHKNKAMFINNEDNGTNVANLLNNTTYGHDSYKNLTLNMSQSREDRKKRKKKERKRKDKLVRDQKHRNNDRQKVKHRKKYKKKRKQNFDNDSSVNKTFAFWNNIISAVYLNKTSTKNLNNEDSKIEIHAPIFYTRVTETGVANLITNAKNDTQKIFDNMKYNAGNIYTITEISTITEHTTNSFAGKFNNLSTLQTGLTHERLTSSSVVYSSVSVDNYRPVTNFTVIPDITSYPTDTHTTKTFETIVYDSVTEKSKISFQESTPTILTLYKEDTNTEFHEKNSTSINDNVHKGDLEYYKHSYASAMEILHEINQFLRENEKEISTEDKVSKLNFGNGDLSCFLNTFLPAPYVKNSFVKYKRIQLSPYSKLHSIIEAEYYCEHGYHIEFNKTFTLVCNSRQWLGEIPRCVYKGSFTNLIDNTSLCTNQENVCEQVCRKVNETATCSCYHGFYLEDLNCTDIDECKMDNGGCEYSCLNIIGSFLCLCPEGYRLAVDGKTCLDINECLLRNGHGPCQDTCTNYHGTYSCSCSGLPGTRLSSDNHTCEDVDECATGTSGCSHTCLNTLGRVFCLCPPGYELGDDWKTCYDINECLETNLQIQRCELGCVNTPGSYYCQGQNDDECIDNTCDNCITKDCNQIIGDESVKLLSNESIVCATGFVSGPFGTCDDINECAENNGGCSHECHNILGSSVCLCPLHLTVGSDWKTCVEMKTEKPKVACPNGYSSNDDNHCEDINECLHNNGGCKHLCTNLEGSYRCSCTHGFALDVDSLSCIEVATAAVCPPLDVPPNGYLHCKRHIIMTKSYGPFRRPRRRVVNHAGTVCILKCPYGGKLQGVYRKTCTKNGYWIGQDNGFCNYFRAPEMKCPDNITVTIPQGQKTTFVAIPQPETSVNWFRNVISEPLWGKLLEADLPAGYWKIKFTARHPISHLSASCTIHIMVNE